MRHLEQLALTAPWIDHEHATELSVISELLDAQPRLAALIEQLYSARELLITLSLFMAIQVEVKLI